MRYRVNTHYYFFILTPLMILLWKKNVMNFEILLKISN